jgi:hypothetical protein
MDQPLDEVRALVTQSYWRAPPLSTATLGTKLSALEFWGHLKSKPQHRE